MSTARAVRIATLAVAAGLAIGLAPAPAGAAPTASGGQLTLYRNPDQTGLTRVSMSGVYPMEQPDAQGYLNNLSTGKRPGGMEYVLYGDDDGDKDPVQLKFWQPGTDAYPEYHVQATSTGLAHRLILEIPNGYLNEDSGQDELYVRATFVDADGGRRSQVSNLVIADY